MTRRNLSQCGYRARSRRKAGDLSSWRGERREACMVVDHSSSTPKELHSTLFWPSPLSYKSFIIQVSPSNLGFSFSALSPGWKIFLSTISTLYDLLVFLPVLLISWEVFHQLIPCPVFIFSLPIIGLEGFSLATSPSDNHQLPHGARLFSFITRFSSSVSHNWVGRFFTKFPFFNRRLSRSTELASKREGNCNVIVTRSTNHMISTHNHSYDLITWSRHVTYKLHPDIKASSILTSASPFIIKSSSISNVRVMTTSWSHSSPKHASSSYRGPRAGARSSYFQIPVVVAWEEVFLDRY